eukprot:Gregarina_sp_Poly_1__5849@NODE_3081_length_1398_cov_25_685950_g1951_i0_p1_GENE_NODE_3081_length_1398_cov_25_685950_g1951_i0NODE_3081_length_1398_cov_25_685950_g1951_i0_p1_ORF_typecomplete_len251_score10_53_NODE_3081_length_1398_cov_25_685950_g1951_i03891141
MLHARNILGEIVEHSISLAPVSYSCDILVFFRLFPQSLSHGTLGGFGFESWQASVGSVIGSFLRFESLGEKSWALPLIGAACLVQQISSSGTSDEVTLEGFGEYSSRLLLPTASATNGKLKVLEALLHKLQTFSLLCVIAFAEHRDHKQFHYHIIQAIEGRPSESIVPCNSKGARESSEMENPQRLRAALEEYRTSNEKLARQLISIEGATADYSVMIRDQLHHAISAKEDSEARKQKYFDQIALQAVRS